MEQTINILLFLGVLCLRANALKLLLQWNILRKLPSPSPCLEGAHIFGKWKRCLLLKKGSILT